MLTLLVLLASSSLLTTLAAAAPAPAGDSSSSSSSSTTSEQPEQEIIEDSDDRKTPVQGGELILKCHVKNKRGAVQWTRDGFALGVDPELESFDRYKMGNGDDGEFFSPSCILFIDTSSPSFPFYFLFIKSPLKE
jgi:hypothetical protein